MGRLDFYFPYSLFELHTHFLPNHLPRKRAPSISQLIFATPSRKASLGCDEIDESVAYVGPVLSIHGEVKEVIAALDHLSSTAFARTCDLLDKLACTARARNSSQTFMPSIPRIRLGRSPQEGELVNSGWGCSAA